MLELNKLKFYIGSGEATASMSRGSFRHRDRVSERRALIVKDIREEGGELGFALEDSRSGKLSQGRAARVSEDGDACTVWSLSLNLEVFGTNRLWVVLPSEPGEAFFGCGETFSHFNLKGNLVRIWTAEHQNARMIARKLIYEKIRGPRPGSRFPFHRYESYYVQPTFVSDRRYFVHVDGTTYMECDFRDPGESVILTRGDSSLYIGYADSYEAVSEGIARLNGIQPRMPMRYTEGITLASQRGIEDAERIIALSKKHNIPLKALWCQDWCGCRVTDFGYQVMWNWEYSRELYPDLPKKIEEWGSQGVDFLGYINPFLSTDSALYREASQKGYCVKDAAGNDYNVTITTFPAAMVDLTNPEAYEWIKDIIKKNLIGIGMKGWMADFGEYLPVDAVLFSGESAFEKHNEWPVLWAKANREAVDECGMQDEIFFFVRAGHSGSVRYAPLAWNGDQHTDWSVDQGIGSVINASLSLSMSGVGVCHSDVGGYTTVSHIRRSPELLKRWAELCCFSPLMRSHEGNRPDANFQIADSEDMLSHVARMANIHSCLGPYIRSIFEEYYAKGTPLMRPLFYHYDEEGLKNIEDEYLLGRDILVAPVLNEGETIRRFVLPGDEWLHLFTGERYEGGIAEVDAPMGRPPVFIRAGSDFAEALVKAVSEIK